MASEEPRGLRMLVNTQTPLIRFRDEAAVQAADGGEPVPLETLREPEDFKFTTGGVTRMLLPLLRRWLDEGAVQAAEWVALAAGERAPPVAHEGVRLSFVGLDERERKGYATVKERMWALLNSNPSTPAPHGEGGIGEDAWRRFDAYQRRSADALLDASRRMGGVDLLYVHDFQQVGVARAWRGGDVAMVFHLHTPFPTGLPERWAEYFVERLSAYDAVVVSTRRYAENLHAAGLQRPIHVVPPFIDPSGQAEPSPAEVETFRQRHGIRSHERVVLHVGRMDPMKAQDRLIKAMPALLERVGDARLVLVGNGSFSNSKKGGLGLSKGHQWRAALEALARDLGVAERVTFTGHLDDALIPAAYAACDAFCLPSTREGFGLAAVEAWLHGKPVVVSDRAGVCELVEDGVNGRCLDCGDAPALADALARILEDPEEAAAMGKAGREASRQATLPVGARALRDVFASVLRRRQEAARASA